MYNLYVTLKLTQQKRYTKDNMVKNQFVITKKIAKHGDQSIIVIPSVLCNKIKPQMLVKITIDLLEDSE